LRGKRKIYYTLKEGVQIGLQKGSKKPRGKGLRHQGRPKRKKANLSKTNTKGDNKYSRKLGRERPRKSKATW